MSSRQVLIFCSRAGCGRSFHAAPYPIVVIVTDIVTVTDTDADSDNDTITVASGVFLLVIDLPDILIVFVKTAIRFVPCIAYFSSLDLGNVNR